MTPTDSKVLAVGEGANAFAATVFPDAELVEGESLPEAPLAGVVLYNVLPTFTYAGARALVGSLAEHLGPGGRMYLVTPSAEEADTQRARAVADGVAEAMLHGRQWAGEVYQSSWTIQALRSEASGAGLVVTQALRLEDQWPSFGDKDKSVSVRLNCVVGERRGDTQE